LQIPHPLLEGAGDLCDYTATITAGWQIKCCLPLPRELINYQIRTR
jgi:hypothetical protein